MSEPTVCAVMLTRDRPALAAKAVECFRRQTYENKRLLIWDTGELNADWDNNDDGDGSIAHVPAEAYRDPQPAIGALRNEANAFWNAYSILIHWDDDDWSHPNRIAEQVALLKASGADVVGYNEMLFWRHHRPSPSGQMIGGEAWLYSNREVPKPTLGTSLCYWRKTWERKPFNPKLPNNRESTGEDWDFLQGLKCEAVSSLIFPGDPEPRARKPRMIARIHGGNTTKYNIEDSRGTSWKRVPNWDNRVREILS